MKRYKLHVPFDNLDKFCSKDEATFDDLWSSIDMDIQMMYHYAGSVYDCYRALGEIDDKTKTEFLNKVSSQSFNFGLKLELALLEERVAFVSAIYNLLRSLEEEFESLFKKHGVTVTEYDDEKED